MDKARLLDTTKLPRALEIELRLALDEARLRYRDRAKRDFYFFCESVIEMTNLHEPFHRPLAEMAQQNRGGLYLLPRGTLKSTILSVAWPLWVLLSYPDTRFLLSSQTLGLAEKFPLEQLKQLKENPVLRFLFPEFCPVKPDYGFVSGWDCLTKTNKARFGEMSVEIASIEHSQTSRHYNVLVFDDVINDKVCDTAVGLQSVQDYYNAALTLMVDDKAPDRCLSPTVMVIGTRWSWVGLYEDLLAKAKKTEGSPYMVRGAYAEDGSLACPTKLTQAFLDSQIAAGMTRAHFSCQYLNNPINQDDAFFRTTDLRYFDLPDDPEKRKNFLDSLVIRISYDPAKSVLDSGDKSGITVAGQDGASNLYVLECVSRQMRESETYNELFRLWDKWHPFAIYIEDNGPGKAIIDGFEKYQRAADRYVNVQPVHHYGAAKELRIRTLLEPPITQNRLWLQPGMQELIDEIARYPKQVHQDLIDSLATHFQDEVWGPASAAAPKDPLAPLQVRDMVMPDRSGQRLLAQRRRDARVRQEMREWKRWARR